MFLILILFLVILIFLLFLNCSDLHAAATAKAHHKQPQSISPYSRVRRLTVTQHKSHSLVSSRSLPEAVVQRGGSEHTQALTDTK